MMRVTAIKHDNEETTYTHVSSATLEEGVAQITLVDGTSILLLGIKELRRDE